MGTSPRPEIVRIGHGREFVGKCPAGFPVERSNALLAVAVPCITTPPYSVSHPKRLYAVDVDGPIYAAETTVPGDSYHGYPYAGKMGKRLLGALRQMAVRHGCEPAFEQWVKTHIQVGGPPDL